MGGEQASCCQQQSLCDSVLLLPGLLQDAQQGHDSPRPLRVLRSAVLFSLRGLCADGWNSAPHLPLDSNWYGGLVVVRLHKRKASRNVFSNCLPDPDAPKDFEVRSWNSSSVSLGWDFPRNSKLSFFLLTAFYLNGTDHVTDEVFFWLKAGNFDFTLSDLQPCSRVRFGLEAVCEAGMESHYSEMVQIDGNSGNL